MDFLNNLVSAAAGYFGAEQKQKADLELYKLGVNPVTTTAPANTATTATASAQIIPGVSNTVVFAAGAGLIALVAVALIAKK